MFFLLIVTLLPIMLQIGLVVLGALMSGRFIHSEEEVIKSAFVSFAPVMALLVLSLLDTNTQSKQQR